MGLIEQIAPGDELVQHAYFMDQETGTPDDHGPQALSFKVTPGLDDTLPNPDLRARPWATPAFSKCKWYGL